MSWNLRVFVFILPVTSWYSEYWNNTNLGWGPYPLIQQKTACWQLKWSECRGVFSINYLNSWTLPKDCTQLLTWSCTRSMIMWFQQVSNWISVFSLFESIVSFVGCVSINHFGDDRYSVVPPRMLGNHAATAILPANSVFLPPNWGHTHAHLRFAHHRQPLRWLQPFLKHRCVKLYELTAPGTLILMNIVMKLGHFAWYIVFYLSQVKFSDRWVVFISYNIFCWTRLPTAAGLGTRNDLI